MSNRLKDEISPYLLQHSENPVDWHPWDEKALQLAKEQNKPIFLSVGYAACHWCHVMERESFEDPRIAELLNEGFVSIKVDREERPDLDNIYMNAVVAMTGQGGWPLNVFLTPEGQPFYGGTYFPPVSFQGLPSFGDILKSIHSLWIDKQGEVRGIAQNIHEHLAKVSRNSAPDSLENVSEMTGKALQSLLQSYDWENGGWGAAPKFPQPMLLEYLIMQATRGGQDEALKAAEHALYAMSQGGMHDLAEGGFHRYSTDRKWLVPHFEKMLYDNAQLARVYLHGYLITKNRMYYDVCTKTLDFIENELKHPSGGFFSSLDADSEGKEGIYYIWSYSELEKLLPDQFELLKEYFEITPAGNFEHKIILRKTESILPETHAPGELEVRKEIDQILEKLAKHRGTRTKPALDDKIVLSWNALALQAFAEAAFYLGNERYLRTAQANADFLLENLMPGNEVFRIWRNNELRAQGFLEDYAAMIIALISLSQVDPQPKWLIKAGKLADQMIARFQDSNGGFFDTGMDHEQLIYRPKDLQDNATPSGNALAAMALLKMSQISHNQEWQQKAIDAIKIAARHAGEYPTAYGYWLQALDLLQGPLQQIAILWQNSSQKQVSFFEVLEKVFLPRSIILGSDVEAANGELSFIDLFQDRQLINGEPTAFICENFTCQLPTNDPEIFRRMVLKTQDGYVG